MGKEEMVEKGGGEASAGVGGQQQDFPSGLHVMVVDDDPICLRIVEKMLLRCSYNVTTYSKAADALKHLRDRRGEFHIVLSDVHMPDMDGFKLLQQIGLELGIPVIMMSSNSDTDVVLRGVTSGAVDYLLKPVNLKELRNIWQHVVRQARKPDNASEDHGESRKRKGGDSKFDQEAKNAQSKKPRVVWSVALHQQFVNAVNHLGLERAVPKRILDIMGVPGLTRENVASHLQKYRLYLKRIQTKVGGLQQGINQGHGESAMGMLVQPRSVMHVAPSALGQPVGMGTGMFEGVNPSQGFTAAPTQNVGNINPHMPHLYSTAPPVGVRVPPVQQMDYLHGQEHDIMNNMVPPGYENQEAWIGGGAAQRAPAFPPDGGNLLAGDSEAKGGERPMDPGDDTLMHYFLKSEERTDR